MKPNVEVVHATEDDLRAIIKEVLDRFPWMEGYPIKCHASCARWDIENEHGLDAGHAWAQYGNALYLLTGKGAGLQA